MKLLIIPLLCFSSFLSAQNLLSIQVDGVPESEGKISVALYNEEESFLKFDKVFKSNSAPANKGTTLIEIDNVPNGEYAVAVFHDENNNDELDTNWIGIPKEKVAFSKGKMKTFGPPKFRECVFSVSSDTKIDVSL